MLITSEDLQERPVQLKERKQVVARLEVGEVDNGQTCSASVVM